MLTSLPAEVDEVEEIDVDNLAELLRQKTDSGKSTPTCVSSVSSFMHINV